MKIWLVILFAGTFAALSSSCSDSNAKETSISGQRATANNKDGNIVSYKVNGQLVKTSGWNISRFKLTNASKASLNVTTNMHEEKRTLNINISGTLAGEYMVKTDDRSDQNFYGSYFPNYLNDLSNTYSFESGSFIISKIDTVNNILEASFSGTAKNIKGEILTISDGKILNGKLAAGVTIY